MYNSNIFSEYSQKLLKFKRILLKLSGECLLLDRSFNIDSKLIQSLIDQIKILISRGIKIAIVIGGGNILRGSIINFNNKIKRATIDSMGIIATMINALALRDIFISSDIEVEVFSSKKIDGLLRVASSYEFNKLLDKGKVLIFAGGTGNPFVTTDSAASLRAIEIGADVLLKATNVNGVYDKDPNKYDDAKRFSKITYEEAINKKLNIMDLSTFVQCRNFNIPIYIFNFNLENSLLDAVTESKYGTWII